MELHDGTVTAPDLNCRLGDQSRTRSIAGTDHHRLADLGPGKVPVLLELQVHSSIATSHDHETVTDLNAILGTTVNEYSVIL